MLQFFAIHEQREDVVLNIYIYDRQIGVIIKTGMRISQEDKPEP